MQVLIESEPYEQKRGYTAIAKVRLKELKQELLLPTQDQGSVKGLSSPEIGILTPRSFLPLPDRIFPATYNPLIIRTFCYDILGRADKFQT